MYEVSSSCRSPLTLIPINYRTASQPHSKSRKAMVSKSCFEKHLTSPQSNTSFGRARTTQPCVSPLHQHMITATIVGLGLSCLPPLLREQVTLRSLDHESLSQLAKELGGSIPQDKSRKQAQWCRAVRQAPLPVQVVIPYRK